MLHKQRNAGFVVWILFTRSNQALGLSEKAKGRLIFQPSFFQVDAYMMASGNISRSSSTSSLGIR